MAYSPYYTNGWQNGEEGGTPITAAAMNHMEGGVEDNAEAIDTLNSNVANLQNNRMYTPILSSNVSVSANGGTATVNNAGTYGFYELCYYSISGLRQTVCAPLVQTNIPVLVNTSTGAIGVMAVTRDNGVFTFTNNSSAAVTITNISGITNVSV